MTQYTITKYTITKYTVIKYIILQLSVLNDLGVLHYLRYVDNILAICRSRSAALAFAGYMANRFPDHYAFSHEHISEVSVPCPFLNFQFWYSAKKFHSKLVLRHKGAYLSARSKHVPSSRMSWVKPYLGTLRGLCTTQDIWHDIRSEFLARLDLAQPGLA